jgi:xanthine dehydrogenase YagT iron-sulfur-binding subunit
VLAFADATRNRKIPLASGQDFEAAHYGATMQSSAISIHEASLESPAAERATITVTLNVNGKEHLLAIEPRVTLLDALRERLHLTGAKKGCDHGQCGACTVLVDGVRINSCLTFAVMHQGHQITTIEGLASDGELHALQAAFIEHDAFQCGYCTPGQILSAEGLLREPGAGTEDELREGMSGNICRCGAYSNILAAIRSVQSRRT